MFFHGYRAALLPALFVSSLIGQEVPPSTAAKIIKILVGSAEGSSNTLSCKSFELRKELQALGVALSDQAAIGWVDTAADAHALLAGQRLAIGGTRSLLAAGAGLVIVSEGGLAAIYIHPGNLARTRVKLSDTILKIAKVSK